MPLDPLQDVVDEAARITRRSAALRELEGDLGAACTQFRAAAQHAFKLEAYRVFGALEGIGEAEAAVLAQRETARWLRELASTIDPDIS